MHRLATIPGEEPIGSNAFIDQPSAPVIFLTSASSDISSLGNCLKKSKNKRINFEIRALNLSLISHPAVIDHYLDNTADKAKLIIVRLIGSKGHWSYGLEQLSLWSKSKKNRKLIIISGTKEEEYILNGLSNIDLNIVNYICKLLMEGGEENYINFLDIITLIISKNKIDLSRFTIKEYSIIERFDWKKEAGKRIGIIYYKSILTSNDTLVPIAINKELRKRGLCPRVIFVDSLRDKEIQSKIFDLCKEEDIKLILTGTSFASINFSDRAIENTIWDKLNIPVLQILLSTVSKSNWEKSFRGLTPLDLSLQVVLPELDGRITTRPCGFREVYRSDLNIYSKIQYMKPHLEGINWLISHVQNWIKLQELSNKDKKIIIMLSNYPVKNGRIANGVGLDTPESALEILNWLKAEGYNTGKNDLPKNGTELMNILLLNRTNDPESKQNKPLEFLSLKDYLNSWNKLNDSSKIEIKEKWNEPIDSLDREKEGFPICGIYFGNIALLIQPSRSYEQNDVQDVHSPYNPPPHNYLSTYFWINSHYKANAIIHLGKHGTVEWLPGKSVGLSTNCWPSICIGIIPHIYPFIVNDPGEGSQSKRRTNALILDHLTPPLSRSELYGDYLCLESLMDEYYTIESQLDKRNIILKKDIIKLLKKLNWPELNNNKSLIKDSNYFNDLLCSVDGYLCEIKESQIRTGLHVLGRKPSENNLIDLLLSISRAPSDQFIGITNLISKTLGFQLDPWLDDETEKPSIHDTNHFKNYSEEIITRNGDIVNFIEEQAFLLLKSLYEMKYYKQKEDIFDEGLHPKLVELIKSIPKNKNIIYISNYILTNIIKSTDKEKDSLINILNGNRIKSGPSGAPTRGRPEVLPTGRNFFSVDLRGLPTEAAWNVGKQSAQLIIDNYLQSNGDHLKHIALSVWGTSTMRNGGEDISQLFALIGVEPVWDGPSRRLIDIRVIPLERLQRPRVDVTLRISGFFRDAFPNLIYWVDKSYNLIGNLDEGIELNPYCESFKSGNKNRIFGSAPGTYGAGLQELINSGNWENKSDLAKAYISWSKWSYNGKDKVTESEEDLYKALKNVQLVMHNKDNNEHDILDSDDYYQFHGGLSATIQHITGRMPLIYISDNSRYGKSKVKDLNKELDRVIRTRLLNPKWIKGIMQHGYKGAFEMGASIDYLFAYDATTSQVPNWAYSKITDSWIIDNRVRNFLNRENPWVLRDIAERLLEASHRKLWDQPDEKQIKFLKKIVSEAELKIENYGR